MYILYPCEVRCFVPFTTLDDPELNGKLNSVNYKGL